MVSEKGNWFNPTKGYGFIQPDKDRKDVFEHIRAQERNGIDDLNNNQAVTFDLEEQNGKVSAVNIELT